MLSFSKKLSCCKKLSSLQDTVTVNLADSRPLKEVSGGEVERR